MTLHPFRTQTHRAPSQYPDHTGQPLMAPAKLSCMSQVPEPLETPKLLKTAFPTRSESRFAKANRIPTHR